MRAKLAEVRELFRKLVSESEKFINPEPEAFARCLKSLLIEGESLRKLLKRKGYNWQTWGKKEERDFLTFMNKQRGDELHHGGSVLNVGMEYVPLSKVPSHLARGLDFSFSMPLGTEPPTLGRQIYAFKMPSGEDKSVVDCCREYLELLERLVAEFG